MSPKAELDAFHSDFMTKVPLSSTAIERSHRPSSMWTIAIAWSQRKFLPSSRHSRKNAITGANVSSSAAVQVKTTAAISILQFHEIELPTKEEHTQ
jgi:hypothetical protein